MVAYTEVPEVAVGSGRELLAEFAAGLAADELGIATPRIRWFHRAAAPAGWSWDTWLDDRHLAGLTFVDTTGEIWLAGDLDRRAIAAAAAHETHHARWIERHGVGDHPEHEIEVMERTAIAYHRGFMNRHFRRY